MSTLHFCTLFDHNYLPRGLVLYETLMAQCPSAALHVLCLNDECFNILKSLNLPNLTITTLDILEKFDPELHKIKSTRGWAEYIFTLSPCWPIYLMDKYVDIEILTSIDCDAAFFSDPTNIIMKHMEHNSVGIVGHRFPSRLKHLEKFGKFNVGFQSFRRNESGLCCLGWWRERCLEWCKDQLEKERFADQKYLDVWPQLFHAKEYPNCGINVAPWNVDSFHIRFENGEVLCNEEPLVFFHFAQLRPVWKRYMYSGFATYGSKMTRILREHVYRVYIDRLLKKTNDLRDSAVFSASTLRGSQSNKNSIRRLKNFLRFLAKRRLEILAFFTGNIICGRI